MNRMAAIVLAWLVVSVSAHAGEKAAPVDYDHLVHKWKQVQADDEFKLVSTYPAPVPFSMNGAPEATLEMSAEKVSPGHDTLEKIVPGEVSGIRKQIQIADYEEQDGVDQQHDGESNVANRVGEELGNPLEHLQPALAQGPAERAFQLAGLHSDGSAEEYDQHRREEDRERHASQQVVRHPEQRCGRGGLQHVEAEPGPDESDSEPHPR